MLLDPARTEVAGYPVVRVMAITTRGVLILSRVREQPCVLRVFDPSCPSVLVDHEIDARARASRAHASALLDLATTQDGHAVAVLDHLGGARLDTLLSARAGELTAGEAVTLLVPLFETVHAAHEDGLTFGDITTSGVRLRSDGAPVLTRFRTARAGPVLPPHFRAADGEYCSDLESARAVAAEVVGAVSGGQRALLLDVLRQPHADLSALADALFDRAEAQPVRRGTEPTRAELTRTELSHAGSSRLDATGGGSHAAQLDRPQSSPRAHPAGLSSEAGGQGSLDGLLARLAVPASIVALVAEAERRVRSGLAAARGAVRFRIRPRFAVVGGAGALAIICALLMLRTGEPPATQPTLEGGSPTVSDFGALEPLPESMVATEGDVSDNGRVGDPALGSPGSPERKGDPAPEEWRDIVETLVGRWLWCSRQSSRETCASAVVQRGSSAASMLATADDGAGAAFAQWEESLGTAHAEVVIIERMGTATIIDLVINDARRASLLLTRGQDGWRLRDAVVDQRVP